MGKKSIKYQARVLCGTAVLDGVPSTKLYGQTLISEAQRTFVDLNDQNLDSAKDKVQLVDALTDLYNAYKCCVGKENSEIADRLLTFISTHNLL